MTRETNLEHYKNRLKPIFQNYCFVPELMWKHIGSCRYIWNYMLALQEERYRQGEKHLFAYDMINILKPLKNDGEHEWLYEVSNASLQTVCKDLDKAYKSMFKKLLKDQGSSHVNIVNQVFQCGLMQFISKTIVLYKLQNSAKSSTKPTSTFRSAKTTNLAIHESRTSIGNGCCHSAWSVRTKHPN